MAVEDDVVRICERLVSRAGGLDKIAAQRPLYYSVRSAVQASAASVRLVTALLEQTVVAQQAFVQSQSNDLKAARTGGGALVKVTEFRVNIAINSSRERLVELIEAAELISDEKDVESLRVFWKKTAETVTKVAMILSGVELVKVAGEMLASAKDVYDVTKSMKNRANQAKVASSLLQWLDTATLACLAWAVEAQMLLNHFQAKDKDNDLDTVITEIVRRGVNLARQS